MTTRIVALVGSLRSGAQPVGGRDGDPLPRLSVNTAR
jgi:hypothetical protein